MKLVTLICAVIFCSCCIKSSFAAAAKGLRKRDTIEKFPNVLVNGTQLNDLSAELVLLILDQLEFPELLALAKTNEKLSSVSVDAFRRLYSGIIISQKFLGKDYPNKFTISRNQVVLYDFELVLDALKYFGSVIPKVRLYFHHKHNIDNMKLAVDYVNKYCSKSLRIIEFDGMHQDSFKMMTLPFNHVEYVSFAKDLPELANDTREFNQLFPAVRHLSVSLWHDDSNYLSCHIPHLQQLYLDITSDEYEPSAIDNLLLANPQIESLEVHRITPELLNIVSNVCSNLETLTMSKMPTTDDCKIHFKGVTKFTAKKDFVSPHITFDNLQELRMSVTKKTLPIWVDFLRQHHVSRLHVENSDLTSKQFEALTVHLPNAVVVSAPHFRASANQIVRFIESRRQLMLFQLNSCTESDKDTFAKLSDWDIERNKNTISFKRHFTK